MHGPQSREGSSGGESSGDEVDLDREVQESLCGLGRNSQSNLGSRSNSRGNPSNSRGNQLPSQDHILPPQGNLLASQGNCLPSQSNILATQGNLLPSQSNLLASQSNLGSLSSFHSAVTRQGSSIQGDTASLLSFQSTSTAQDSSDTASFYSTGTLQGSRSSSRVESPTSFYSTGTLQGSPSPGSSRVESPSSLSYQSLGSRGSVETLVTSTPTLGLGEEASTVHQVNSESLEYEEGGEDFEEGEEEEDQRLGQGARQRDSYVRPGCLAGSAASGTTGSTTSLASEGEVSFAGRVNEQVGRLLGYSGGNLGGGVEGAMAAITGYEVVAGEKEKYTVYKLKLSAPGSVPSTWFLHRRYSDFLTLRATLIKESPSLAPRVPFPPKRWVGSNLEPAFLGRRLAGLQVFLATVMEDSEMRRSPALSNFLCLDQQRTLGATERPSAGTLEASRAVCDTLEETVRELREQLRKREQLEGELEAMRNQGLLKDAQISHLEKENELLRQQKESLMAALRGVVTHSSRSTLRNIILALCHHLTNSGTSNLNTSLLGRRERRASKGASARIESLEDFTAKFGLNNTSSSTKSSTEVQKKRESNNNVTTKQEEVVDYVRRRRGLGNDKGLERESSIERRKSSIQ